MLQRSTDSIFFRHLTPLAVKVLGGLSGCIFVLFMGAIAHAHGVTGVLQYHNDPGRTGWNSSETVLTPANVTSSTFGLIASVALDGAVDAQPLVKWIAINGTHPRNVVYVATENNSVYAIDGSTGSILLQTNLGTPIARRSNCGLQTEQDGIVSTPAIDVSNNTLFLISLVLIGGTPKFRLHALNLQTLRDKPGSPVTLSRSQTLENGSKYDLNAFVMRQRPALLLAKGNLYAAFGGCGGTESMNARGWVLGWNASTLAPIGSGMLTNTLVLKRSPLFYLSSIWMSGYGVAADLEGNLYFATGNSNPAYNTYTGTTNIQESAVKLSPTLKSVLDLFTPSNVFKLDKYDTDLGSGGVLVIPAQPGPITHLAFAAGKDGRLFIMNRDDMGGFHNPDIPAKVQIGACWCGESYYQGSDGIGRVVTIGGTGKLPNGNVKSQVAVWKINTNLTPALTREAVSPLLEGTPQDPGGFTSISSNKTIANTAIIWAVGRPAGIGNHVTLWAFNGTARSGRLPVLWSGPAGSWSSLQYNANLVPTVANGKVYVASDHQLAIFGLLPAGAVRNNAKLQPAPPPAPLVKVTGALIWGTVESVHGSYIGLTLRTGKLLQVDLTKALPHGNGRAAVLGRNVAINGDFNAQGMLDAHFVWRVKGPMSWGPDIQG
jgi:hypothetical protein